MCFLFEQYLSGREIANKYNLNYKLQEITNLEGINIGYEILIDAKGFSVIQVDEIYNKGLMYPHPTKKLMRRIENYIEGGGQLLSGKSLFVNLERSHLCDKFLLCDIVILSKKLAHQNASLIIELTERDICGKCSKIDEGIYFLKQNKILLALDDYNINEGDFRNDELDAKVYNFIKIDFSSITNNLNYIDDILKKHNLKLIVEYIESESNKEWISKNLKTTWALQGYLYNTFPIEI